VHRDVETVVKRAVLVVLVACSPKSAPPSTGSAAASPPSPAKPALPRPTMKSAPPIDLSGAPIKKLEIMPVVSVDRAGSADAAKGVFDVNWVSHEKYEAAVVCRIESYNLAYFGAVDNNESLGPDEHEVMYRPDPFVVDPKTCEVRFRAADKLVARACYQSGKLTEGTCPDGTFPPPKLPAGIAIDVQGASVHIDGTTAQVKAMFTVGAALTEPASFALICDGVASAPDKGEGFVPLSKLDAGETLYTWQLIAPMTKELPGPPKQCQLTITGKHTLGKACIADGSTEPGPCGK
jgi:hypothetical protein